MKKIIFLTIGLLLVLGCATTEQKIFSPPLFENYCNFSEDCTVSLINLCTNTNGTLKMVCGSSGIQDVCDPGGRKCICPNAWDFEKGCI